MGLEVFNMKRTLLDILSGIGAMLLTFLVFATPVYAVIRGVVYNDAQCLGGIAWGILVTAGLFLALLSAKEGE